MKQDGIISQLKKLSALLRGITSENNGDFYCLNCLHTFRTKNKLQSHKKVCENEDFCNIGCLLKMPSLEINQYKKADQPPFVIYADLDCS